MSIQEFPPEQVRPPLGGDITAGALPYRRSRPGKHHVIHTLREVVRFRTIADGKHDDHMRGMFDYIAQYAREVTEQTGKQFYTQEWNNDGVLSTVITRVDPTRSKEEAIRNPKAAVLVHADVVGAEQEHLYEVEHKGDKIYGRGPFDMKGILAMSLGLLPDMPVGTALIVTSDEENGGLNGAKFLADTVGIKPEFLIIFDGQKPEHVSYGSKAVWHTRVSLKSALDAGGHGSRYEDYSAIELAADFRSMLRRYYPWSYDLSPDFTTINFGIVHGGVATNKVAQDAFMNIDMRFPSEEERERGKKRYMQALRQVFEESLFHQIYADVLRGRAKNLPVGIFEHSTQTKDGRDVKIMEALDMITGISYELVRVETLGDTPVYAIDRNHPRVRRFVQILQDVTGKGISINEKDTGGNDGRHFPNTPAFICLPAGGGAHTSNEWVSAESLMQMRDATLQFLEEQFGDA